VWRPGGRLDPQPILGKDGPEGCAKFPRFVRIPLSEQVHVTGAAVYQSVDDHGTSAREREGAGVRQCERGADDPFLQRIERHQAADRALSISGCQT
jgi:hypothetical protein